jgi:hypothetical protein
VIAVGNRGSRGTQMPRDLNDPFESKAPLSGNDQAVLELFTSLMNVTGVSSLAAPPADPLQRPGQMRPPVPDQPKPWGRLTRDNWNIHEACRRDNVRCLFDFSPSTSPLPEFAGKTPATHESFGYPCSEILLVDECWKYYGYDPKSNESCSPEILHQRMERCVELRLRDWDELSSIDVHELHCLRTDGKLHLRFWKEFPAEGREMTIKLLCHERKMTREQAEEHIAGCEKARASWK